jgi:murein L,D-transpeptidase YcbB/YkuD
MPYSSWTTQGISLRSGDGNPLFQQERGSEPEEWIVRTRQGLEIASLLIAALLLLDGLSFAQVSRSSLRTTRADASSTPKLEGAAAQLSGIVASGRLEDLRWPDFSGYRSQLAGFYRGSGYTLAWVLDGKPTSQAVELIGILQDADREGLRAEDYDASRWADRLTLLNDPHEPAAEARFDAALTVCVMRYLSDLHVGRISTHDLGFEFDNPQAKLDLAQFVRSNLVNGSNLRTIVAEVEPPFDGYKRLRDALPHYEELAKKDTGEKLPPYVQAQPGNLYDHIARVASLLRLLGDLPENAIIPPDAYKYEGVLIDAVKHFQVRHGLAPTGEIDFKTIAEMNVPLSDRVEQIRLGLERYRSLPYHFNESSIVINVPEFRLYCFEGDRPSLTMNVNVGDQYDFQTPMFEKNMEYVVFRPYWYPPPGILRHEIIPNLVKHPSLHEIDLELVSANGQIIKSGGITPAMFQQIRTGELTVRAPPAPDNAMGLVKFMFPNQHQVYIHGTAASDEEFSGKARAVSTHGCIHAEKPAELAAWVLRNNPGWDLQQVEHAMHEGRDSLRVNLASPIPVLVVYQTAVVEENGEVRFFHDIYRHDATLEEELAKGREGSSGRRRENGARKSVAGFLSLQP